MSSTSRGTRRRFSSLPRFSLGTAAGLTTLLLVAGGAVMSPQFVTESAGPTFNTIGEYQGKQLLEITGHQTYPTRGNLDMTTVYVAGGPNGATSSLAVLGAWLRSDRSVYPSDALYPPETTQQQVSHQNTQEMTDSQTSAQAAAAKHLHLDYSTKLTVTGLQKGSPAGVLSQGDVLTSVNGKKLKDFEELTTAVDGSKGHEIDLGYRTAVGQERRAKVTPRRNTESQKYQIGVMLKQDYDFPFQVHYGLESVGGPSAGMMFTLGIIDEMTPGEMTGGKHFAGTGTIDADGKVGPIGGIQEKLVGARESGATVFLAPAQNCGEVSGHVPDGLSVIKVNTLDDAVQAVQGVAAGKDPGSFPQCG